MKNFKRILMGLCVVGLLCLGVVILKPESHHDGGSGVITSNLTDLWANFIYLKGRGYLNIYPYGLELNLIGLLSSLSPHIKKRKTFTRFMPWSQAIGLATTLPHITNIFCGK